MPTVIAASVLNSERGAGHAEARPIDAHTGFRLRAIMRQGSAASLPEVWQAYPTLAAARALVHGMYADARVLRVFIVTDEAPPQFVEWVER
jgi:hypothetical protein